MKKIKICESCNEEFEISKKEKVEIKMSIKMLKMVNLPGSEDMDVQTKGLCGKCQRKVLRSVVVPAAESMIGAMKKADKIDDQKS